MESSVRINVVPALGQLTVAELALLLVIVHGDVVE